MNCSTLITLSLTGTLVLLNKVSTAQSQAFERDDILKVSGMTTDAQIAGATATQKLTTIKYYDGLGRPVQSVIEYASPLQHDMIQPVAYDNLGRQTKSYLPYADENSSNTIGSYRANAVTTDQPAFYNNTGQYVVPVDTVPFARQVFEKSPLQRLLLEGMVGTGFQPGVSGNYTKSVSYRPNNSASDGYILMWNPDGTFTSGTYYANNTLNVTDGKDEDNIETLAFTDLAGRTVLKRQILSSGNLDTYYIYDNAGLLVYVVPPAAIPLLIANSYNLTAAPLSNLVFHYVYDNNFGRVVQKYVPAKGVVYIVYDPVNRPVLVQDANMRVNNNWYYVKYDAKGRPVSQGIYTDATHTSISSMQSYVSGLSYSVWYESPSTTLTNSGYYTNNVFPTTGVTPLSYAYYDNYTMGTTTFSYLTQSLTGEVGATAAPVKGMPTMVSKTTVGAGLSSTWLTKVVFYDKRGNTIQTRSNNQLNYTNATTLTDVSTTVPDFVGVPQISLVKKALSSGTTTVQTSMTYDQMNRPLTVSQQYNGGTAKVVAAYSYNEMGQVIKKGLGFVSGSTYLQNVDMRYNIRGQLLSINNSTLISDGGHTNGDSNDVFGMQLLYDQTDSNLGNAAYYNGKLSAVKWMTGNGSGTNTYERAYKYLYDGVNRYTGEHYAERNGSGSFNNNIAGFDERSITYDGNGNILKLSRNSSTQGTNSNIQIDSLVYSYSSINPNQLLTVTDVNDANHLAAGFRNYTGSSGSYTYDANGNLTSDPYKGLGTVTPMQYNVLNRLDNMTLTYNATGRYIKYTYSADGTLIRKQAYDNNTLGTTTDYIDGFVYVTSGTGSSALSYFPMPEGRVLYASGTFTQEFIIADQQGNARVSFQNNGSGVAVVKQENSYYGYGMAFLTSPVGLPTVPNKQLYNGGSEWQNDYSNLPDYQQTFYRNYDAALGRFVGVDPVAESAESMTGYQYAGNNPIMGNDPNGDISQEQWDSALEEAYSPDEGGGTGTHDGGSAFSGYVVANGPGSGGIGRSTDGEAPGMMGNGNGNGNAANYSWGWLDGKGLYESDPAAYLATYYATGGTMGGQQIYNANAPTDVLKQYWGTDLTFSADGSLTKANFNTQNHGAIAAYFDGIIMDKVSLVILLANQNFGDASQKGGDQQSSSDNGSVWSHLIGPTLIALAQPINALKPIGMLGSKPGSSLASYTLRKVVPGTLKGTFGKEAGGVLAEVASTNGLGAALGRFVPWVGWAWTYTDVTWTIFNKTLDSAPNAQARQDLLNGYNFSL